MNLIVRLAAVAMAWFCALSPSAFATCVAAPDLAAYQTAAPEDFALGASRSDRLGRVVAPVFVNGEGPFRFIVDTGANRSVLSSELALRLGLAPDGEGEVHSVYGASMAPLARVRSITYENLDVGAREAPILSGAVLAGEHGLLGADGMRDRRLRLDFERNCIEILPSREARRLRGWAVVRGELRFGHLVVIPGSINGVRVRILVDTGSDSSLANLALRDALRARERRDRARLNFALGGAPIVLDRAIAIHRMNIGDLEVRDVTAYVDDFHVFRLWGFVDEPALLMGMDVLSQTRGVAIDYGRGTVAFRIRGPLYFGSRVRN